VARSFSGDAKQVRELLKAALHHRGTAVLDIISPCVAFNNGDTSTKSYGYGREHEAPLHGLGWVPQREEIEIADHEPGEMRVVELHDGSFIQLRKLEEDYDPADKMSALQKLYQAQENKELITGLLYFNPDRPNLAEISNLVSTPLSQLPDEQLRPPVEALAELMAGY